MDIISIRNVSKKFRLYHEKNFNIKYAALNFITRKKSSYYDEFWALKNINLNITKGETVGIIGENGSGKSTLLKIIAGILYPNDGEISKKGKIAALIEVGAGFHYELSGRENIYLNASILGFSKKEIDANLEKIIAFSGLKQFIDNPIKTYSSGMYLRLGFSIAIHVNPDILLVDEVLAVGDENFQKKCLQKIDRFRNQGKTIVLVSHDLSTIEKMCDRVVLLDNGMMLSDGNPVDVISYYHKILYEKEKTISIPEQGEPSKEETPQADEIRRWGSKEVEINRIEFLNEKDTSQDTVKTGDFIKVRIHYFAKKRIKNPVFGVAFYREDGIHLNGPNTKTSDYHIASIEGKGFIDYIIHSLPFQPGIYFITVAIVDFLCLFDYDHWHRCFMLNIIENEKIKEKNGVIHISAEWRHHGQG